MLSGPRARLVCVPLVLVAAGVALADGPVRQSDRERSVYVSVVDDTGAPARDLRPADFTVREDGVQREVLRVEPATGPIDVALLVDNSEVMEPAIADVRQALKAFAAALSPHDPIAVVTLADRPTLLVTYILDRQMVDGAIDRVFSQPGSGTRLLDAVVETSRGLDKRDADRAALVVVTAQGHEFSEQAAAAVLEALAAGGATLHAEVLANLGQQTQDDPGRERARLLAEGSSASGGRYRTLLSSMALTPELTSLAAEINGQVRVVYGRPEMLIPPSKIEVGVKRPGFKARATPGRGKGRTPA